MQEINAHAVLGVSKYVVRYYAAWQEGGHYYIQVCRRLSRNKTAQKASLLIGRIRHHFAVFSVLYKAESDF
jgi:hypothetical protein